MHLSLSPTQDRPQEAAGLLGIPFSREGSSGRAVLVGSACRLDPSRPTQTARCQGTGSPFLAFYYYFYIFFNAQSCPQIEIVSSRCCSRTLSLLFPTRYLNFSGGWRLIDVSISFYSTSVKSKLPSQSCCRGSSSSKAAEQPSQGGEMVGGGQGWQAASDQLVRLVFKTSQCFSSCGPASLFLFLRLFVPVLHQQQHQGSER